MSPELWLFYTCKPRINFFSPRDFSNLFKFRKLNLAYPTFYLCFFCSDMWHRWNLGVVHHKRNEELECAAVSFYKRQLKATPSQFPNISTLMSWFTLLKLGECMFMYFTWLQKNHFIIASTCDEGGTFKLSTTKESEEL